MADQAEESNVITTIGIKIKSAKALLCELQEQEAALRKSAEQLRRERRTLEEKESQIARSDSLLKEFDLM